MGQEQGQVGIREATGADLLSIAAILNREIAESPYVYAEEPVTLDERKGWLSMHRAADLPVIVATDADDAVVGWGSLSPYRSSSGYRVTLEASVYVARDAQRRGIGQALLAALHDAAKARRSHAIVASIDSDNAPSIRLFERFGYREVARLPEVGRKFDAWRTQLLLLKLLAAV
jgi:L-amino acid N-acyltransferase YncA